MKQTLYNELKSALIKSGCFDDKTITKINVLLSKAWCERVEDEKKEDADQKTRYEKARADKIAAVDAESDRVKFESFARFYQKNLKLLRNCFQTKVICYFILQLFAIYCSNFRSYSIVRVTFKEWCFKMICTRTTKIWIIVLFFLMKPKIF